MAKITVSADNPSKVPKGADLTLVENEAPVAVFAAAIASGSLLSGGEMKAHLIIPYEQIPNAMPAFQYVGGVVFRVTVERVTREELPEGGW